MNDGLFRILDAEGNEVGPVPKALSDDDLVAMLRLCIFGREFDKKAISLQRRGKLGTFAPMSGQEAVVVGSVFALDREQDWVVPQYREQLAMLHWGLELSTYFLQRQGHPLGSTLPEHGRLFPQQVALAAHLPHASAWRGGSSTRRFPRSPPVTSATGPRPRATSTKRATWPAWSRRR